MILEGYSFRFHITDDCFMRFDHYFTFTFKYMACITEGKQIYVFNIKLIFNS